MKEAGFLLSCAYDKTIIVWKYEEEREVTRYQRSEELRCMDYLASMKMLFVGTNQKSILTINIDDLLAQTRSGIGASMLDESLQFRISEHPSFRRGDGHFEENLENLREEDLDAILKNK